MCCLIPIVTVLTKYTGPKRKDECEGGVDAFDCLCENQSQVVYLFTLNNYSCVSEAWHTSNRSSRQS